MSAAADDPALHTRAAALEGEVLRSGEAPGAAGQAGQGAGAAKPKPKTGELIGALLIPTFKHMAPLWGVADEECMMLGEAYGAVIDKYFPDLNFGPEAEAVFVTLAIFGPRWGTPMRNPPPPAPDATAPAEG